MRGSRALSAWLTLTALFLNVLASAVLPGAMANETRNMGPTASFVDVIPICTPNGIKMIRLGEDGTPLSDEQRVADGFCALCLPLSNTPINIPTAQQVAFVPGAIRAHLPVPSSIDPVVSSLATVPAQPRAPPAIV